MGKTTKGQTVRAVKEDAITVEAPINNRYVYVQNDDTFTLDNAEFEMVQDFLTFVRNRERGTFTANIISHQKQRYVILDFVDKKRIDLKPVN